MESQHLDNKPLGRFLDLVGYVIFVAGLVSVLIMVYLGREELARKLDRSVVQMWPIVLAIIGFVLFFLAKMSRIKGRSGEFWSEGDVNQAFADVLLWIRPYGSRVRTDILLDKE